MMEKLPPIEKIYEAYTAIADERVSLYADHGEVLSSDLCKTYTVSFKDDVYASDDNATYWQAYAGYPVIAVLFKQGRLAYDEKTAEQFKGINWNGLNKRFKRKYSEALAYVMEERKLDQEAIEAQTRKVYDDLQKLDISIRRGKFPS